MANLTKTFVSLVETGWESIQAISDPEKKALAVAELAKAVAATGLVGHLDVAPMTAEQASETKEAIKADKPGATTKAAPEPEKQKVAPEPKKEKAAPAPKKEEPAAEVQAQVTESSESTDEWNEVTEAKYAKELEYIGALMDSYGDEGPDIINECVADFSEGNYKSFEDITPSNIIGFVAFLELLLKSAEEEAQ